MSDVPTPKDRFSSLDTVALVRELRGLDRARVDKAFDLRPSGWSLVFRVPGTGRKELVLVPGRYAALLDEGPSRSEELSPFAKELRRLLTGAVLRSVAEPGGERLLELMFSRSDAPSDLLLSCELFGSGNLIVAREGRIAAVAHPRVWAHRAVRVGAAYQRPPARADPWGLTDGEIEAELARSRSDLASTLAARLGLGGPVAEEVIARGGWHPEEPASREPSRVGRSLHRVLQELWSEIGERPVGFVYRREGTVLDATAYPSRRWQTLVPVDEARRNTFSEAAAEYFSTLVLAPPTAEETEALRARQELERLAERQTTSVTELEEAVRSLQLQAETILAHYAEAEARTAEATARSGSDLSFEATVDGRAVRLLVGRTPRESAQVLFEESKRVQSKLAGARAALGETERRLAEPMRPVPHPRSTGAKGPASPRRAHWFEQYRWFISSEGAVVVAGRDASSNDTVVKRHLKEGDVYVHADLHGAASVVVKHPPPGAPALTDSTYREAGQWAVAFSKAWRAGHASASAFWVTPEQVSKTGASGEFVARGAWVIHGTKNFLSDLPTELGLGTIQYEGQSYWTAAPPTAVRKWGDLRALLTPGPDYERSDREVELARELSVPRSLLQALLPSGGLSIRRP